VFENSITHQPPFPLPTPICQLLESPVKAGLLVYTGIVEVVKLKRSKDVFGSLDRLKFELGDEVTVSVHEPMVNNSSSNSNNRVYNLCSAIVLSIDASSVTLGLESKMRNPSNMHGLYHHEKSNHQHRTSGDKYQALQDRDQVFKSLGLIYRIDKFEWSGSPARRTLVHLLTSEARMIQLNERNQRSLVKKYKT
jgi:hypothetical protein